MNNYIKRAFYCLFIAFTFIIYYNIVLLRSRTMIIVGPSPSDIKPTGKYIVYTKGCRIPYMDPYDKMIRPYLYYEQPIVCDKDGRGMLVNYIGNTLYVNMTLLPKYGLTEETLNCCYQAFSMVPLTDDDVKKLEVPNMRYDKCIRFTAVDIKDEFVKVKCSLPNHETYEDVFVFVQKREENSPRDDDKLSVLVIGFDAVSRLNFHRQMTKTVKFIKEQNAVEMYGFHKVGDNTYPNLVATLTGLSVEELEKLCAPMEYKTFDNCPLIWKKYNSHGFTTAYGEDLGQYGLLADTTKFRKHEFKYPPTDYFLNPLSIAAHNLRHEYRGFYNGCIGKRLAFEIFTDAIKQFAINLKNLQTFGFFWSFSLSHEKLNLLRYTDDYVDNLLRNLSANGVFNKSILILMSDHGIRYGKIRETYQGYLEEMLPFVFFKYPSWFPSKYPKAVENLKANAHRLITAFDLYKTLDDLIDLKNISNNALDNRLNDKPTTIGTSLFLPINESRTCDIAGIPEDFCACNLELTTDVFNRISNDDRKVIELSNRIVEFVNNVLLYFRRCRRLNLHKIIYASVLRKPLLQYNVSDHEEFIEYYRIIVETKPNMARFESFVKIITYNNSFLVIPPVNRVNAYGNQSYCVDKPFLKPFCFCKRKQLNKL